MVTTFELPGCYDMWTVIAPVRKEEVGKSELRRSEGCGQQPSSVVKATHACVTRPCSRTTSLWHSQEETPKAEGSEQEPSAPEAEDDGRRHGFLILSREDSTMVGLGLGLGVGVPKKDEAHCCCLQILQTGQEIMELDTSGFATQGPTVFAGNIGDNRYIVQVSPLGIRLLEGGGQVLGEHVLGIHLRDAGGCGWADHPVPTVNQLHFIPVDLGAPIVQCAVADPYVVIMSAEGHVTMFLLKSDSYGGRHHRLALHKPPLHHVGPPSRTYCTPTHLSPLC